MSKKWARHNTYGSEAEVSIFLIETLLKNMADSRPRKNFALCVRKMHDD
jgi:hypothetical protein